MSQSAAPDTPRTAADVRLEVAAARNVSPTTATLDLRNRRDRVAGLRQDLGRAVLELSRAVDRYAAVNGEAWTLEALGMTEQELLELCRAKTPSLAGLATVLEAGR